MILYTCTHDSINGKCKAFMLNHGDTDFECKKSPTSWEPYCEKDKNLSHLVHLNNEWRWRTCNQRMTYGLMYLAACSSQSLWLNATIAYSRYTKHWALRVGIKWCREYCLIGVRLLRSYQANTIHTKYKTMRSILEKQTDVIPEKRLSVHIAITPILQQ